MQGRPQRRVAGHRRRQRHTRDNVGERQPSARAEQSRRLSKHGGLVRRQVDHAIADHDFAAPVRQSRLIDERTAELDGRESVLFARAAAEIDDPLAGAQVR